MIELVPPNTRPRGQCIDRICLEGDNQKQADFLAEILAGVDPSRIHDLHIAQWGIVLQPHLDPFERSIARKLDFSYSGPQGATLARAGRSNGGLLGDKTTHAALRSKPSWCAVSTDDRTINPDLERFMAKRMGAKTIEVKASHLSLISQPDTITNLILAAAGDALARTDG